MDSLPQFNDSPGTVGSTSCVSYIFPIKPGTDQKPASLLALCVTVNGLAGHCTCRNRQQKHKYQHRLGSFPHCHTRQASNQYNLRNITFPTQRPTLPDLSRVGVTLAGFIYQCSQQETIGDFMWFVTSTEALFCKLAKVQRLC